ncbi:MAG TPA: hypothetical protein VNU66_00415, partial [Mycobacteriales bacterium]|nr:hypothetical protein [Mycobacteriales bacterium]
RTPSAATLFAAVALPTVPVLGPSSPLAARPASAALTPVPAEAPAAEPVAPARPPALLRPHEARAERPDAVEADEAPAAAELEPAPVRGLPALSARAEQLLSLGLPEHLLPASDDPAALVESLRRLPRAPRPANRPGQVLAVVGPVHLALSLGRQLAAELGLTPSTALVLAGPSADEWVAERQAVLDVPTAAERRAAWKRRRSLTVVAVDCPVTAAAALRAREFLGALAPCATWVTVEASRKTHDLAAWTGLVGSVDALAVQEVDATMDPASVLRLGIPVARLGPRTATPAAWASLLTSRLAA